MIALPLRSPVLIAIANPHIIKETNKMVRLEANFLDLKKYVIGVPKTKQTADIVKNKLDT